MIVTAIAMLVVLICTILACFDYSPTPHHSHYQKRNRGKFVKRYQEVENYSIRFVQIDERKFRRV